MTIRARARLSIHADVARPATTAKWGGWPVVAMFAGYPLWWAVGLGAFALFLLAIPTTLAVLRQRRLVLPRGAGLYLLFLVFVAGSALMLGTQPPHTRPSGAAGLLLGYLYRSGAYVVGLAILLYVTNSSERRLPTGRLLGALAVLFVATVAGGWLGLLLPRFEFTSPFERFLPRSLSSNLFVNVQVHPKSAEVQNLLGSARARPSAPFDYTNSWGANLSLLLPMFLVAWRSARRRWQRIGGWIVLAGTVPPLLLSLNRGAWAALGLSAVLVGAHTLRARRVVMRAMLGGAAVVAVGALALAPLRGLVADRLSLADSDSDRAYMYRIVLEDARHSPLLGWGTPRRTSGGPNGIASGPTVHCPPCGVPAVGTHGTFWTILFSNGVVALGLFVGFLLSSLRRLLVGRSDLEAAAALVVIVFLLEMLLYNQLPTSLAITMAAIGLGWRAHAAGRDEPSHPVS